MPRAYEAALRQRSAQCGGAARCQVPFRETLVLQPNPPAFQPQHNAQVHTNNSTARRSTVGSSSEGLKNVAVGGTVAPHSWRHACAGAERALRVTPCVIPEDRDAWNREFASALAWAPQQPHTSQRWLAADGGSGRDRRSRPRRRWPSRQPAHSTGCQAASPQPTSGRPGSGAAAAPSCRHDDLGHFVPRGGSSDGQRKRRSTSGKAGAAGTHCRWRRSSALRCALWCVGTC